MWRRAARATIFAFAAWTILCHAVVLPGGNAALLRWLALGALILAAAAATIWLRRRQRRPTGPRLAKADSKAGAYPADAASAPVAPFATANRWQRETGILAPPLCTALCLALAASDADIAAWFVAVLYLGVAAAFHVGPRVPKSPPPRSEHPWLFAGLVAIGALAPLMLHRLDLDDVFYVNLAVAVADFPDLPLLRFDTLHGIPDIPILLPTYRVQSLEPLVGTLAHVTGIPAIVWLHLVLPPLAGALTVVAYAKLFRLLTPGRWFACTVLVVSLFLVVGDAHGWYGNLAFVRLHQSKSIFATVVVPWAMASGVAFGRSPGWRTWLDLAAIQIAAVGLTATAVWVAPLVAGLGVLTGSGFASVRTLAIGALASSYPAAIATHLWFLMAAHGEPALAINPTEGFVRWAANYVLGSGPLAAWVVGVTLVTWRLCPEPLARRFALLTPLGFLACFSPLWDDWLTTALTGDTTYWRVFWLLPAPALLALAVSSPLAWGARLLPAPRGCWPAGVAVVAIVFALFVPQVPLVSKQNHTSIRPFALKVPQGYGAAQMVVRRLPGDSMVLAPEYVSVWLPTFHHAPQALATRALYLLHLAHHLGPVEAKRRVSLMEFVGGEIDTGQSPERFGVDISDYPLSAILVNSAHPQLGAIHEQLRRAGWVRAKPIRRNEVWMRGEER